MTGSQTSTPGTELQLRLQTGIKMAGRALEPGARVLAVLTGVTQNCMFLEPQENVLARLSTILVNSERVYRYGNSIVIELIDGDKRKLVNLAIDHTPQKNAVSHIANIVTCEITNQEKGKTSQFATPRDLVHMVLNHEPTLAQLPNIKTYAHRPLFDDNFYLCTPGWNSDSGYLIHSDAIEPILPENLPDTGDIASRFPPRLREVLADFCFKTDADRVNAVGAMLTGLLVNQFIPTGKPMFVLDGNQPSVGKTLFARVLGVLFDGEEPMPIKYTDSESELEKKICANLESRRSSILLIDNAKLSSNRAIESIVIEVNSTAPHINLRILKVSKNHEQPNDLLWILTMNNTKLGGDLSTRSCPIRFHYDGSPNGRSLTQRDLIKCVRTHRNELLGELSGMVIHWCQQGQPPGHHTHRLDDWARKIGGILQANNLPGFLENMDEADAEFNTQLDDLTALAEKAVQQHAIGDHTLVRTIVDATGQQPLADCGLSAGALTELYLAAGVLQDKLRENKSTKARANIIARHLSQFINGEVQIDIPSSQRQSRDIQGVAILRMETRRARGRIYFFDFITRPHDDGGEPCGSGVTIPTSPLNAPPFRAAATPRREPMATPLSYSPGVGNDLTWQ